MLFSDHLISALTPGKVTDQATMLTVQCGGGTCRVWQVVDAKKHGPPFVE